MPAAAGPDQGQQRALPDELGDLDQLCFATDERGRRGGQVAPPRIERADGREVARETVDLELPDPLGRRQVLEPVLGQVANGQTVRERLRDERPGRVREEDLTAVPGSRDPGRPMDVHPNVAVTAQASRPGVQSHPNPYGYATGPRVRRERPLSVGGRPDRVESGGKDREEGVSLGAHLGSGMIGDRSTDQVRVRFQDRPIRTLRARRRAASIPRYR